MTTRACLLTPAGRGAIATIHVEGDKAVEIAESLFESATNRAISTQPVGRILFGRWRSTSASVEELVVCRTDDNTIEVQCHGGPAAVQAILKSLRNCGCDTTNWKDVVRGEDYVKGEARVALALATTERTASHLLDQLNGSLSREVTAIQDLTRSDSVEATERIDRLLESLQFGLHLTTPWRVVIAGPPNVGKSSLINALVGYERAIVFDQPGTTRDVVSVLTAFDGWPTELSDTAGIRDSDDLLERAGIEKAIERITGADLVIQVHAADEWSEGTSTFVVANGVPEITVINKCDLASEATFPEDSIQTIATESKGVDHLIKRITNSLTPSPPKSGDAVVFTNRQRDLLRLARQSLADEEYQMTFEVLTNVLNGCP